MPKFVSIGQEDPMNTLCRMVSDTNYGDLPSSVINYAKHSILDTIAIIIGGSAMEGIPAVVDLVKERGGQLESIIRQMKEGLETLIGKNGIRLSGGQRQRLAIARLILSNPKIVIFDEATSALDNATEFHLYETLAPFLKGRTTIIIAHRTTTIKQADHIYLIEEGRVQAEGSYEELQAKGLIKEDFDVV